MKKYSVVPNKDVTGWFVKLEDVAPENEYVAKDDAIQKAEQLAMENSPSKIIIMDKNHDIVEERSF
ncbi:DUF2188 domain-containing protein [Virgibacillus ndiopensis]|uniref:DUF2188 domain-containing protein n=1 Tax=Virgibacillus ndiopensis TaxID=2004408 RepID=UPI000C07331A|nr:DUF2188 domain-containing protein [Virgibacillus ndiopensis]